MNAMIDSQLAYDLAHDRRRHPVAAAQAQRLAGIARQARRRERAERAGQSRRAGRAGNPALAG